MRLLEWPFGKLTESEATHVRETIETWSAALAAHSLPGGAPLPNRGAAVAATRLELARDEQWMMTRHRTFATYHTRRAR